MSSKINMWWNGRHAVITLEETYRVGELGGQTANVSSWRLYLGILASSSLAIFISLLHILCYGIVLMRNILLSLLIKNSNFKIWMMNFPE